jgi:hypothetical protein
MNPFEYKHTLELIFNNCNANSQSFHIKRNWQNKLRHLGVLRLLCKNIYESLAVYLYDIDIPNTIPHYLYSRNWYVVNNELDLFRFDKKYYCDYIIFFFEYPECMISIEKTKRFRYLMGLYYQCARKKVEPDHMKNLLSITDVDSMTLHDIAIIYILLAGKSHHIYNNDDRPWEYFINHIAEPGTSRWLKTYNTDFYKHQTWQGKIMSLAGYIQYRNFTTFLSIIDADDKELYAKECEIIRNKSKFIDQIKLLNENKAKTKQRIYYTNTIIFVGSILLLLYKYIKN